MTSPPRCSPRLKSSGTADAPWWSSSATARSIVPAATVRSNTSTTPVAASVASNAARSHADGRRRGLASVAGNVAEVAAVMEELV